MLRAKVFQVVMLSIVFAGALAQSPDFDEMKALAEQGNATAQFILGVMYLNGEGVPQDYAAAMEWYKLAVAQGNADAQYNLGLMNVRGQGVIQDHKEAVRLYGLAAAQGYATAQYNLGLMYVRGQGVIQDDVYAHMWLNIAASSGDADAVKNRDIVAGIMTASQLEKAQELARECVKKEYKGC